MRVKRALWALAMIVCLEPIGAAVAGTYETRKEPVQLRGIGGETSASLPAWASPRSCKRLLETDPSLSNPARRYSTTLDLIEPPTVASALTSSRLDLSDLSVGPLWVESNRILDREPRGLSPDEELAAEDSNEPLSIPEPASLVLLVTGLVGLVARRHIHRQRTV